MEKKGTDGGREWGVKSPVKELGFCTHPPPLKGERGTSA